jgi:hypothetical protein
MLVSLNHYVRYQRLDPLVVGEGTVQPMDHILRHRYVTRHQLLRHWGSSEFIRVYHHARLRRHHLIMDITPIIIFICCTRADARISGASTAATSCYLPAECAIAIRLNDGLRSSFQSIIVEIVE